VSPERQRQAGEGENGEGGDPLGTHGRAYYAPCARVTPGFDDAYDLLV
jgi:hypothetical protein